jgi:DNA-binding CsgD family transcriptional regulator
MIWGRAVLRNVVAPKDLEVGNRMGPVYGGYTDETKDGADLIEREAELAVIADALEEVSLGEGGRTLLIEGPAGIGKTTLMAELKGMADEAGFRVLRARGSEIERDFAFGVVRQLFGAVLRTASATERERMLSGPSGLAASIFGLTDVPTIEAGPAEASLYGLYWLATALSEAGPVVVALDDAHWCDTASLRFIEYLGRRLAGVPLLIALAARPAEPGVQTEMLRRLRAELEPRTISPSLLSEGATAAIVSRRLGEGTPAQVLGACHLATGGNPLLIEELLAELDGRETPVSAEEIAEMGPKRIAESLINRAGSLGREGPTILDALAVLGDGSELRAIGPLARVEPGRAAEIVDGLAAASILEGGADHRFAHPLLGSSIYESIPTATRGALHARAAELLEGLGASAEEITAHLLRCEPGSVTLALDVLELAAGRASASGAPDSAATYLRRALEETMEPARRGDLLRRLGRAEVALRDPAALAHLEQATRLAADPSLALDITLELGDVLALAGQWEPALQVIGSGLDRFGATELPGLLDLEAMRAAARGYDPETVAEYDADLPRLLGIVKGRRDAESSHLRWVLGALGAIRNRPRAEVLELIGPVSGDWSVGHRGRESSLVFQAVMTLLLVDALEEGEEIAAALHEEGRRRGSLMAMIAGVGYTAALEARRGQLGSSEASMQVAFELMRENELSLMAMTTFLHFCVDTLLERSGMGELAELVEGLEMPPAFGRTMSGAMVLEVRGALRAMRGDRQAALADLRDAELIFQSLQAGPRLSCWRSRLALVLPSEATAQALGLAAEELELTRLCESPRAEGIALRTLGLLEGGESGIERLRDSVAVLRSCDSPLELARSLTELGSALRRGNRRSEARDQLREALNLAQRCGAERLEERVREEVGVAGGKPRRSAISGPDSLTPAEHRVAMAAATGATNREIAQSLFVSLRTVEMHLTNTYRKLDDCSRADLAVVIGEAGG